MKKYNYLLDRLRHFQLWTKTSGKEKVSLGITTVDFFYDGLYANKVDPINVSDNISINSHTLYEGKPYICQNSFFVFYIDVEL